MIFQLTIVQLKKKNVLNINQYLMVKKIIKQEVADDLSVCVLILEFA